MSSYNKVVLMGNATRDAELRYTPGGKAVADIGLATNRKWKDQGGNQQEEVTFVDITFWGRQAEIAGQYVKKGNLFLVEGRLQLDQWEDKETHAKRSKLKVVAENLKLMPIRSQPREDETNGGAAPPQEAPPSQVVSHDAPPQQVPDEEVPF